QTNMPNTGRQRRATAASSTSRAGGRIRLAAFSHCADSTPYSFSAPRTTARCELDHGTAMAPVYRAWQAFGQTRGLGCFAGMGILVRTRWVARLTNDQQARQWLLVPEPGCLVLDL